MSQRSAGLVVVAVLVGAVAGAGIAFGALGPATPSVEAGTASSTTGTTANGATDRIQLNVDDPLGTAAADVDTFENASAFRSYVREGSLLAESHHLGRAVRPRTAEFAAEVEEDVAVEADDAVQTGGDGGDGGGSGGPARIAGTNVQVGSLDEPDIVKTDGRRFYYAPQDRRPIPIRRPDVEDHDGATRHRELPEPRTHVIDASDPDAPEAVAHIDTTGKLLQTGETLVVFEHDRIAGYDVSDPAEPAEAWSTPLNGSLVTARESNGTLYVVTETPTHPGMDCPVEPLGEDHPIPCEDIYRPGTQIPVDATYTAFSVDAGTGEVHDSVSFVGTGRSSVVYVSADALYVTYTEPSDRASVVASFVREEFDRAPDRLEDRVAEIQSYDITPASKVREIRRAVEQWAATLPEEEREEARESFHEGLQEYVGDHKRNLTQTGVVRVDVDGTGLSVDSTGTVPGRPLNQFSLDQHDGTLRITTTIPATGAADSENDLYVLDADSLERRGNVTGMGVTERVYSVRYVDDTAYVVTFRRIDPFHVVDLSDPENPEEVGELELPGFSSYLHPIDDDHVLGVGEERGKVKTVLFDVSDPSKPTVDDSRVLEQGWSAVAETHHAFLIDRKHEVFVLPAGQESVVMDYTDGSLDVETTVGTDERATRARYVDDSLYVFAGDSVTVVDQTSWEQTATLDLDA